MRTWLRYSSFVGGDDVCVRKKDNGLFSHYLLSLWSCYFSRYNRFSLGIHIDISKHILDA